MYQPEPTHQDIINKLDEIIKEQREFIDYLKCKDYDKEEREENDAMERPEIFNN